MLSTEAARIRAGLEQETIDPNLTPELERRLWDEAASQDLIHPGTVEHHSVIGGVPCRMIEPAGAPSVGAVVYVHGGGFVSGSPTTHRSFASRLAHAIDMAVVVVDYRLLPEHSFPVPVDDVTSVVTALATTTTTTAVGERSSPLILAGDSTGAALALAAACRLRDIGASPVHGIISVSGAFDCTLSGESIDAGLDPQLSRAVLKHWQATIVGSADVTDPVVSPLFADLAGLPPLLLLAGGHEAWLSDSLRMADRAERAGCVVELCVVDGMWHVWPLHGDFPEATAALRSVDRFITELPIRRADETG